MTKTIRVKSVTTALTALAFALFAQIASAALDSDLLAGMQARAIGPAAVGGRITAIDVVQSNTNHIVIGAATGGVWVSHSGGLAWEPVFDDQPVASIGAVAINQSNPDIIWVGTGEGNTRNSTSIGGGIFKSIDGGRHWQLMGLPNSERINRIALHPDNPDIAYVAALGTLWAGNTERGLFRTMDGGKSWQKILYVDDTTGATDIKMDPSNPNKLFAGMWQFRRWPFEFKSGGPGSGMYISQDGGDTWVQKTEEDGLPKGDLGRMVFSIPAANPDRVYALVEAKKSALLRSDNGGVSWTKVNEDYDIADRPFYYSEIAADPENPDRVYNIATRLRISIDGGISFKPNEIIDCCAPGNTIHIDNHALWINPADPRHLIIGNDGGIAISHDKGETWRFVRNLPLAQFYHIAVDNELPYNVYGGLQDNGSWRGPSEVWVPAGIRNLHWQEVGFGDGFDTIPDPENARAGYVMSQGGFLLRYDLDKGEQKLIRPAAESPEQDLRFNWDSGFAQDPFDTATIYYGSQFLHKSTDRGLSWSIISDDLTSNNPDFQSFRASGGITSDVTAAENYTSIVAVAPSKLQKDVLWVGTDDGRVHITRDGGESWKRVDSAAKGAPAGAWVHMITPSPHDAGTAFVVFDDHRRGNMKPFIYRVENFGAKWTSITASPLRGYALSVLQDAVDPDLLFAGTEFGLFVSIDAGKSWTPFKAGVPTVSVMDMAIQPRENDLVLGTHGRSVFVIDDYSGLRDLKESDFQSRLKILSASPGQQYSSNPTSSTRFTGSGEFRGENEPYGVMLTFIASGTDLVHPDEDAERARKIARRKSAPATAAVEDEKDEKPLKVTVKVSDSSGSVIRTFKSVAQQGINRLAWGMQIDGVRPAPSSTPVEEDADLPAGPEVVPGTYRVELSLGEASDSMEVEVLPDPRYQVSTEARQERFDALRSLMALEDATVTALERIDSAQKGVSTLSGLVAQRMKSGDEQALKSLKEQVSEVSKGLSELEKLFRTPEKTKGIVYDDFRVTNKLGMAQFYLESSSYAPGPTAMSYVSEARSALQAALARTNEYLGTEVAALSTAVSEAGISLLGTADPVQMPE